MRVKILLTVLVGRLGRTTSIRHLQRMAKLVCWSVHPLLRLRVSLLSFDCNQDALLHQKDLVHRYPPDSLMNEYRDSFLLDGLKGEQLEAARTDQSMRYSKTPTRETGRRDPVQCVFLREMWFINQHNFHIA